MSLRNWPRRRIAWMWVGALAIETIIIGVSAYQGREARAAMNRREREFASVVDTSATLPARGINPRADSARDSAMVLLGRLLADKRIQNNFAEAMRGMHKAAADAAFLAAILLFPVPLAASLVTVCWFWVRRRADLSSHESAA